MLVQVAPPQLFLETCDRRIAADHEEFHTSHFRKSDAQKKLPADYERWPTRNSPERTDRLGY
jgi:hypothetical protein